MQTINYNEIYANPNQPRKHFDQESLEGLAQSIKINGLLERIVVVERSGKYMIVAGERRYRACIMAGIENIPVEIIEADEQKIAELALLENLQRLDLNIIEEAQAFQGLVDLGLSHEEISRKMGIKQVWRIQERLNILKLNLVYQEYTIKNILTPSQAQELSRLPREEQDFIFDKIAHGGLNTYNKLRAMVNAILYTREQTTFFPEPTREEIKIGTKYDRMIEKLVNFVNSSFDRDDLSVLASVLTPAARQNIEKIDLIVLHLNKIKKALIKADSTLEVVKQAM